jgi:hypothetical protein
MRDASERRINGQAIGNEDNRRWNGAAAWLWRRLPYRLTPSPASEKHLQVLNFAAASSRSGHRLMRE